MRFHFTTSRRALQELALLFLAKNIKKSKKYK